MSCTIGELIKELQRYDEDMVIKVEGKCGNMFEIDCLGYSVIKHDGKFGGVIVEEDVYIVLD